MTTSPATSDWPDLADRLAAALRLAAPPVAITFHDEPPEGVPAFSDPMPEPLADGRTGRVAAGCVFWFRGTGSTFSTVAADHGNCSVGSLVHGFLTLEEAAANDDVETLLECGWVSGEAVPGIPVVTTRPGSITYGPLAETPFDPDVVFLRVDGEQMMVLSDALPGLRIEGKPQCHIIALAREHDQAAASWGCALSRVRTGMSPSEITCALPAHRLAAVVSTIEANAVAETAVARYAAEDKLRFG